MPLFRNMSASRSTGRNRRAEATNLNDVLGYISQATPTQLRAVRIALEGKEVKHGR